MASRAATGQVAGKPDGTRQVVFESGVAARGPAEVLAGAQVGLPVDQLVWLPFDELAFGEAERGRAWTPPAAGRLAGLGSVDVVAAADRSGIEWPAWFFQMYPRSNPEAAVTTTANCLDLRCRRERR